MNRLNQLESLAQRLIEGAFGRLFQSRLHPAELARHLAQAIEAGCDQGQWLPNHYEISLSPEDYASLLADSELTTEATRLRQFLQRLAQEVPCHLADPLSVSLSQSEALAAGQVRVESSYRPPGGGQEQSDTKQLLPTGSAAVAKRWGLQFGHRQVALGEPVVRIGRALDNDLVLIDPTVSRYHAELRWRKGQYHLYPPVSAQSMERQPSLAGRETVEITPRTALNDQSIIDSPLQPGDIIELGNTKLKVVVEPVES